MDVCTEMTGTHVAHGTHVEMSAKASIFLYVNVLKFFSYKLGLITIYTKNRNFPL